MDRKLLGTSTIGPHPARSVPAVAPRDPPRSAVACRSAIGRPILETETILTSDGKVHVGLVKEVGDSLWVITPDGEAVIPKADIDERTVQKKSLMPDGQHLTMSPAEFADLIAYLRSL